MGKDRYIIVLVNSYYISAEMEGVLNMLRINGHYVEFENRVIGAISEDNQRAILFNIPAIHHVKDQLKQLGYIVKVYIDDFVFVTI
jgi:hypothetical protein